jgi:type II secretory pathway pseudopilin PulG
VNRRRTSNRRGIIAADVLAAFALLIVTGAVLMIAVTRQRQAATRLADTREAARLAEGALADLQSGLSPSPNSPDSKIVIRPADGGNPIAGQHWVEVEAAVRGQSRILVGLVPDSSPPTTRPAENQP